VRQAKQSAEQLTIGTATCKSLSTVPLNFLKLIGACAVDEKARAASSDAGVWLGKLTEDVHESHDSAQKGLSATRDEIAAITTEIIEAVRDCHILFSRSLPVDHFSSSSLLQLGCGTAGGHSCRVRQLPGQVDGSVREHGGIPGRRHQGRHSYGPHAS
jgi:hypothetical protein